jgi:hypothetical protein
MERRHRAWLSAVCACALALAAAACDSLIGIADAIVAQPDGGEGMPDAASSDATDLDSSRGDASRADDGSDGAAQTHVDSSVEASTDSSVEASTDSSVEASTDSSVEASTDSIMEASIDSTVETTPEAGAHDSGADARIETGPPPCGIACDPGGQLAASDVFFGVDTEGIAHVVADGQGDFYVAGVYDEFDANSTALQLGDAALPAPEQGDAFLAKLDANGNVLWAQAFAGPGTSTIRDLVVDGSGNIVVLGAFATDGTAQGAMHIGTSSLTLTSQNIGTGWLFLASFDASGNAHWADRLWDTDNPETDDYFEQAARLAAGPNNLQVLAASQGTLLLTWGSNQSGTAQFSSVVGGTTSDIFLIQLNLDGTFDPAFTGAAPLEPGFYDIGCNDADDSSVSALATTLNGSTPVTYIAGECATPSLPSGTPNPRGINFESDANGGFLLQLEETTPAVYGANVSAAVSVTNLLGSPSGDGTVYDALASNVFTLEWRDPETLTPNWSSGATTAGRSEATALTLDEKGNVVGMGTCSGSLSFNTTNPDGDLTGGGLCVAAYDKQLGHFAWADTFGVTLTTVFRQLDNVGIAATPAGGVGFGGTAQNLASLDGGMLDGGSTSMFFGVLAP